MKDTSRMKTRINDVKLEDTGENGAKSKDTKISSAKLKSKGINDVKMKDTKIKKLPKGNIKGRNVGTKDTWNKPEYLDPEEDPRFHDTYKFLRRYRDATYSLKVVVRQMETQFRMKYGTSVDEFLDSIYTAGVDLSEDDIEERAKSIERSNRMLRLLDSSVDLLRNNHKHGNSITIELYHCHFRSFTALTYKPA